MKCNGFWGWILVLIIAGAFATGLYYAFRPKFDPPSSTDDIDSRYSEALKQAMQFFDIQKSGKLVQNKIAWRGDSGLEDGSEANLELSKGMYDAGDHMKFGFPMAYTATVLSWGILEYFDHMKIVHQLDPAKSSLKWITDYLINAHPVDDVLYIQVGDPKIDHKCWVRPENMTTERPVTQVNTTKPGTDVAAETAAAMAAASLVFKKTDSSYSVSLLNHSKQLFDFANEHRARYSVSIPQAKSYYNSSGYGDELLWAAAWLYHATREQKYLDFVIENGPKYANFGKSSWFTWDNKLAATQVLLSRVNFFVQAGSSPNPGLDKYKQTAETFLCSLIPDSPSATASRTDGGLIWVSEWNSLHHPVAAAFLAVIYSDYMHTTRIQKITCSDRSYKPSDLRNFAKSQADYVLGNNPLKMSYLVGYGEFYPKFVHHRGASIPKDAETGCEDGWKWLESKDPNPNVATGALVGGPYLNETYVDSRNNSKQGEPTTYNSALIVGLLSALVTTSHVTPTLSGEFKCMNCR